MDNTKEDNGVLIYVAIEDRNFVIYGDKGINKVVPPDFWETTKDEIVAEFKKGDFKQGLINGISKPENELQKHFPWRRRKYKMNFRIKYPNNELFTTEFSSCVLLISTLLLPMHRGKFRQNLL